MSRIGKKPIPLPAGVKYTVQGNVATVEGPKGKVTALIADGISLETKDGVLHVVRESDKYAPFHGLTRALVFNAVHGVTEGWKKELDIVGVGYKAAMEGGNLRLDLGYSHPINYVAPEGITIGVEKNTHLTVNGIDRQLVGQVAADIRKFRKPEPYKGKGVQYTGEVIRRKAGKTGK